MPTEPAATLDLPDAPAEDMYTGGTGSAPGQFADPRGIALDKLKHVYVADTGGNGRIQEFSSDGSLPPPRSGRSARRARARASSTGRPGWP